MWFACYRTNEPYFEQTNDILYDRTTLIVVYKIERDRHWNRSWEWAKKSELLNEITPKIANNNNNNEMKIPNCGMWWIMMALKCWSYECHSVCSVIHNGIISFLRLFTCNINDHIVRMIRNVYWFFVCVPVLLVSWFSFVEIKPKHSLTHN